MNRLEIFVLNRCSQSDGVYTKYIDIPSTMSFLGRTGHVNHFSIVARKGKKSIFIEKLDPTTLLKELTDFQNLPQ